MSNKIILGVTICAGLLSSAASIMALSSRFSTKPEAASSAQAHPAPATTAATAATAEAPPGSQARNARPREQFLRSMTPEQKERLRLMAPEQRKEFLKELVKEERAKLGASAEPPAR